jgi:hypothetical protein
LTVFKVEYINITFGENITMAEDTKLPEGYGYGAPGAAAPVAKAKGAAGGSKMSYAQFIGKCMKGGGKSIKECAADYKKQSAGATAYASSRRRAARIVRRGKKA